ncbi:MAG: HD domain-containing protein, partial [Deltaproteobacteria bacterium]|nr:HD domain-containing protein [Deltaproteobacteria bacterium]
MLAEKVQRLQNELTRCYVELERDAAGTPRRAAGAPRGRFQVGDAAGAPPVDTWACNGDAQALETVCLLANVMEARDPYVAGHSRRVAYLARLVGEALQWPREQVDMLEWAGLLHDVGKIGTPERILQKPERLDEAELREVRRHPRLSFDLLKPVTGLGPVLKSVLHHHENHDGSGYPDG